MGKWYLDDIRITKTNLTKSNFGHALDVKFHLRYVPSTFGKFYEPQLDWTEQFWMNDHGKNINWVFGPTNMYEHNPDSQTFYSWRMRYVNEYRRLPTLYGNKAGTDLERTAAVRSHLRKKGGKMVVQVVDIPSLVRRQGDHKERLLRFDIGIVGQPLRAKMEQYVELDMTNQTPVETEAANIGFWDPNNDFVAQGNHTPPPDEVSRKRDRKNTKGTGHPAIDAKPDNYGEIY